MELLYCLEWGELTDKARVYDIIGPIYHFFVSGFVE